MGGVGSGQWYRWNSQTTIEETPRIDVRYMERNGCLKLGRAGSLSWSIGGEPSGSINYTTELNSIRFNYWVRSYGDEEWQPVSEFVRFDWTPCHLGGSRRWFLCPGCDQRVAILCSPAGVFRCRNCHNLPYASQNESRHDRLFRKQEKLGRRIFEDYDNPRALKRKGTHLRTFERELEKYWDLEDAVNASVFELFAS